MIDVGRVQAERLIDQLYDHLFPSFLLGYELFYWAVLLEHSSEGSGVGLFALLLGIA